MRHPVGSPLLARAAVLAVAALAAVVACEAPEQPPLLANCASNSQCPLGSVCDTRAGGTCVTDDEVVAGTFSCTVQADDTIDDALESASDVGGKSRGAAIFLNARAVCVAREDRVEVVLSNPFDARPGTLTLRVPRDAEREVDLAPVAAPARASVVVLLASGRSTEGALGSATRPYLGLAQDGFVAVEGGAEPGAKLSASLFVRFRVPPAVQPIGEPCESDGDCGPTPVDQTFCARPDADEPGTCTQRCSFATDCTIDGGHVPRCLENGLCGRGCVLDEECAEGQRCDAEALPPRCVSR